MCPSRSPVRNGPITGPVVRVYGYSMTKSGTVAPFVDVANRRHDGSVV